LAPIHWRKLEKVFLANGFSFDGQQGSHRKYSKPGIKRPIVIPRRSDIPPSIIANNLKTAGLSVEDYFRLLEEI